MKTPTPVTPVTTTLSDDQMQALAQSFHDIAVEIGQVRLNAITAGSKLTDPAISADPVTAAEVDEAMHLLAQQNFFSPLVAVVCVTATKAARP